MHVDARRPAQHGLDERAAEAHAQARAPALADHDLRDVLGLRLADDLCGGVLRAAAQVDAAERVRQGLRIRQHACSIGIGATVLGLHREHVQLRVAAPSKARAGADELGVGVAPPAGRHEHTLARPQARGGAVELGRRDLRELVQDEGPQRREVADREEAVERLVDALGAVDQAARDALAQRCRAQVDELDLVGLVQQAVGERLSHLDARQRADAAAEALEVLDVDRRPDVDAMCQQGVDVVVALGPRRVRRVRVGELVDDRDARPALDQPVDVGLRLGPAARSVAHDRRVLEAARALLGRDAAVRLEVADHDVGALLGGQARVAEHLVGLADAGGRAQVDAQESARSLQGGRHVPSLGIARPASAVFRRPSDVRDRPLERLHARGVRWTA